MAESPPPEHLAGDYVALVFLAATAISGGAINLVAFRSMCAALRKLYARRDSELKLAFLLLKLNLNVGSLLVLLVHCPVELGWLWTYRWLAGDFLCRFCRFFSLLSFQISSNTVAVIAVDRYRNVERLMRLEGSAKGGRGQRSRREQPRRDVFILLAIAWGSAIASSLPQLWTWEVALVAPDWPQCLTQWDVLRLEARNANRTAAFEALRFGEESLYTVAHLLVVFWIPLAVILASYAVMAKKLLVYSCTGLGGGRRDAEAAEGDGEIGLGGGLIRDAIARVAREQAMVLVLPDATLGSGGQRLSAPSILRRLSARSESETSAAASHSPVASTHRTPRSMWRKATFVVVATRKPSRSRPSLKSLETPKLLAPPQPCPGLPPRSFSLRPREPSPSPLQRLKEEGGAKTAPPSPKVTPTSKSRRLQLSAQLSSRLRKDTIPSWRIQMRSTMFRTTLLIVSAYLLLWLPYNALSILRMLVPEAGQWSQGLDWLKKLMILNALLNPFLYQFRRESGR